MRCIGSKSSTKLFSQLPLWYIKQLCELLSLSEKKEPLSQALESLFDHVLLKPRLVLVLPMLLLHTSGIPFLPKYEQLRLIPYSAEN